MSDKTRNTVVAKEIKPLLSTMVADLINKQKTGGNTADPYAIILYDADGKKKLYYSVTTDGLTAALAGSGSGDVVLLPACTISGNFNIPDGASLIGVDRKRCILDGQITPGINSTVGELSIVRSESSGTIYGVASADNNVSIYDCLITISNSGGGAIGIYATGGVIYANNCIISATGSTSGYGYYAKHADIHITDGSAYGSTQPIGAE